MLTVAEALSKLLAQTGALPSRGVSLTEALGHILASDIASDIDSPPHDKAMMDGYAVRYADVVNGRTTLEVIEEITAGDVPQRVVNAGQCARIMTGAPLPAGADAVVMVERTRLLDANAGWPGLDRREDPAAGAGSQSTGASPPKVELKSAHSLAAPAPATQVEINDPTLRLGQNIMRQGDSLRRGEVVLKRGAKLGPAEIGLLAEVGCATVPVFGPVRVAILSTGNELVPHDVVPSAGQIRNSNGPLLAAAVKALGATAIELGIARDEREELKRLISRGLESDVLILSGGVSAGVLDLVPGVLAELGVREVFHKVRLKPGKPLWFGVTGAKPQAAGDGHKTLVFGLPGNPVSSLVCFELFVKPAIQKLAGRVEEATHRTRPATLTTAFTHRGDRPTYYPAVVEQTAGGLTATPTAWRGSADLRGFAGATALIVFPAGERVYQPGEEVAVILLTG